MNDATRRALRTAAQGIVGFAGAGGFDYVWKQFLSTHGDGLDPFVLFVVGLVLTGVTSWAHNLSEDKGWLPAVGKAIASSGAKPVTVDPPK